MKRIEASRAARSLVDRSHGAQRAHTGTHCPVTGWWEPIEPAPQLAYVWKGSTMPGRAGHAVEWRLVRADPGGRLFADQ